MVSHRFDWYAVLREDTDMQSTHISRARLLRFLEELEQTQGEFITVYLTAGSLQVPSSRLLPGGGTDRGLSDISEFIEDEAVQRESRRYGTGLVLFYSAASLQALVPPLPIREDRAVEGKPDTGALREMLGDAYRVAFVLVTWGAYNAAIFQGTDKKHGKKGTGHIHPHHKKGGSSAARFQRRTEEQR
ncbi:MAG: Vms1/Ankzf1 family peptidyl-tRNA hydrolase, partial [Chloroflexota bacterium]